jgi:hypothetical protein
MERLIPAEHMYEGMIPRENPPTLFPAAAPKEGDFDAITPTDPRPELDDACRAFRVETKLP